MCAQGANKYKKWTHTIFSPSQSSQSMHLSKGNCISNNSSNNKPRDSTHATLSPYGKHHACPHTTVYNIPDDTHSVQLGNATTTAAVSDDYLHDQSVLSSFHSKASRWFPLSLGNVYTTWVRRKGLTFSGTNRPSLGLCWDQFVS